MILNLVEDHLRQACKNMDLQDWNQVISLLAKFDFDDENMWVTDGLVFSNAQQDYNEGVNPLCLQWKDSLTSFYPMSQSRNGQISVNLRLEESLELKTGDDQIVPMTAACYSQIEEILS